jgi:hypothetical protein
VIETTDSVWSASPARRYFDYPEYAPQSDTRLLYPFRQEEVIEDLDLTHDQISAISNLNGMQFKDIPGGGELVALNVAMLKKARSGEIPPEQYRKFLTEWNAKCRTVLEGHTRGVIGSVLTEVQKKRLREIEVQTKGPALIFFEQETADALELDAETRNRIVEIMTSYGTVLQAMRTDLEQIVLERANNPDKESQFSERQKKLLLRMRGTFDARDAEIVAALTPEQRRKFRSMGGTPLAVKWQGISDFGFRFQPVEPSQPPPK